MAMPLQEIEEKVFSTPRRGQSGVDADEVHAFLLDVRDSYAEVQESYQHLIEENQRLVEEAEDTARLLELERNRRSERSRSTEPAAPSTTSQAEAATGLLMRAQQIADAHVAEAKTNADQISADASDRAHRLLEQAQQTVDETLASIRVEAAELEEKVNKLRAYKRDVQQRLRSFHEAQLNNIPQDDDDDNDLELLDSSSAVITDADNEDAENVEVVAEATPRGASPRSRR